jgi:hypothetical protein
MAKRDDNEIIERAFGKIAILADKVEALLAEVAQLREGREHDMQRIQFLSAQVERVGQLPEVLTAKEAAKALGISDKTLWNYKQAGLIEFIDHPGSRVTYLREHIERFLQRYQRGGQKAARLAA